MGKLNNFSITFSDNQNGVYFPGQTISGTVVADLSAPMDLRGKILGIGYLYQLVTIVTSLCVY